MVMKILYNRCEYGVIFCEVFCKIFLADYNRKKEDRIAKEFGQLPLPRRSGRTASNVLGNASTMLSARNSATPGSCKANLGWHPQQRLSRLQHHRIGGVFDINWYNRFHWLFHYFMIVFVNQYIL
jgi:hypothetical protein